MVDNSTKRLVLGTAQLGMSYGIANSMGQPDQDVANAIVREAWDSGICKFDTAQAYGDSERVLGAALNVLGVVSVAKVISKLDPRLDHLNKDAVKNAVDQSLARLRVPSLYCLMLHQEETLSCWDEGMGDILQEIVSEGKVEHIGVSVYSPEKALEAMEYSCIDVVQLPSNLLDRRFERAGVCELAQKKDKEVHVRSIFLQGLILMDPCSLSSNMHFARAVLEDINLLSNEFGLSRQELALAYIKCGMPDAHLVFGAERRMQVADNVATWNKDVPDSLRDRVQKKFVDVCETMLNPALWPKGENL